MVTGSYLTAILTVGFRIPVYTSILYVSIIGALINLVVYELVFHWLLHWHRKPILIAIATLTFGLLLSEVMSFTGYLYVEWRQAYPFPFIIKEYDITFGQINGVLVVSTILTVTIYLLTRLLLQKTGLGVRLLAFSETNELVKTQGISSDRLYSNVWLVSGGLACLAGGLYPLYFSIIPSYAFDLLISVLAVSLLGGMGSIMGGFYGCIAAFIEIVLTVMIQRVFGTEWGELRLLIPLLIIILVLMFRPKGITGESI